MIIAGGYTRDYSSSYPYTEYPSSTDVYDVAKDSWFFGPDIPYNQSPKVRNLGAFCALCAPANARPVIQRTHDPMIELSAGEIGD